MLANRLVGQAVGIYIFPFADIEERGAKSERSGTHLPLYIGEVGAKSDKVL